MPSLNLDVTMPGFLDLHKRLQGMGLEYRGSDSAEAGTLVYSYKHSATGQFLSINLRGDESWNWILDDKRGANLANGSLNDAGDYNAMIGKLTYHFAQPVSLSHTKFEKEDFSNQDLSKKDMSYSQFLQCDFDGANLSEANCEFSDFSGSTFRDSNVYRTNFRECKLAGIIFEPKDAYGVCFSFTCLTFQNIQINQLWFYSWLLMATMMYPAKYPVKEDLREKLIALIGAERWVKLKALFQAREF